MNGAASAVALETTAIQPMNVLEELVLARASAHNGATRADLIKDLSPLTSHRLSPSELRRSVDGTIGVLEESGFVAGKRGRYRLVTTGEAALSDLLGERKTPDSWGEMRDTRLVAHALGLAAEAQVLKALARPDGLRAYILQRHYSIGGKRALGTSRLRMALAVIALERAFGNKIKSGFDAGRGLSVKASRLLAGQLARRPRDFGTDTRLIGALAAEAISATQADPASLRLALLRQWVSARLGGAPPPQAPTGSVPEMKPANDPDAGEVEALATKTRVRPEALRPAPPAASRPDLDGFVGAVRRVAEEVGEGWPGNRKALIVRVWRAINAAYPDWGLSDIEFKGMLTEAHRTGHLVLGSADLKAKVDLEDVQASAIAYKNTVWHFVRV